MYDDEQIVRVLREEVVKRDTLEGPEAEAAARRVNRVEGKRKEKPAGDRPTLELTLPQREAAADRADAPEAAAQ